MPWVNFNKSLSKKKCFVCRIQSYLFESIACTVQIPIVAPLNWIAHDYFAQKCLNQIDSLFLWSMNFKLFISFCSETIITHLTPILFVFIRSGPVYFRPVAFMTWNFIVRKSVGFMTSSEKQMYSHCKMDDLLCKTL